MKQRSEAEDRNEFNRRFFDAAESFTFIGKGKMGGKARGLADIKDLLEGAFGSQNSEPVRVEIPRLIVITTDLFDQFMAENRLNDIARSDEGDEHIAHAFQKGNLPPELVGSLRALVNEVHTPLAVRSSSLLEDALAEPFAGVYATKMVPNNQFSADARFRVLVEAVKFVYASTYFRSAKNYLRAAGRSLDEEKMAVIIQEVVGARHKDRFYPHLSGVARSYNFYPLGRAKPSDGVVSLALGLGKTIVDGGRCWTYCPLHPKAKPPFSNILKESQTEFWAVNMGKPPAYDPIRETEYLTRGNLEEAEEDETLRYLASTYDPQADRLTIGIGRPGPRVLDFAPLLQLGEPPLNDVIHALLERCTEAYGCAVEIEFAATLDPRQAIPARLGFLQVRPMLVTDELAEVKEEELSGSRVLTASERTLGNGVIDSIRDVVYVKPDAFSPKDTRRIARELEEMNRLLLDESRPYLLIVCGRLGTADPWLGIPVEWGQVSGARVIVETHLPQLNADMSQGSHFFHNIINLRVCYFSTDRTGRHPVRWEWLDEQESSRETLFLRHVKLPSPLLVKVDGRSGRGVVKHG